MAMSARVDLLSSLTKKFLLSRVSTRVFSNVWFDEYSTEIEAFDVLKKHTDISRSGAIKNVNRKN